MRLGTNALQLTCGARLQSFYIPEEGRGKTDRSRERRKFPSWHDLSTGRRLFVVSLNNNPKSHLRTGLKKTQKTTENIYYLTRKTHNYTSVKCI